MIIACGLEIYLVWPFAPGATPLSGIISNEFKIGIKYVNVLPAPLYA